MITEKIIRNTIFIIAFAVLISYAIFTNVSKENATKKLNKEFTVLIHSDSIKNEIIKIHDLTRYALGIIYVTLDNGKNYKIVCDTDIENEGNVINDLCKQGDYLIKYPESDTIYLLKGKTHVKYNFLLSYY